MESNKDDLYLWEKLITPSSTFSTATHQVYGQQPLAYSDSTNLYPNIPAHNTFQNNQIHEYPSSNFDFTASSTQIPQPNVIHFTTDMLLPIIRQHCEQMVKRNLISGAIKNIFHSLIYSHQEQVIALATMDDIEVFLQTTPVHSEQQVNRDILKFSLTKYYHSLIDEVLRNAVCGLAVQGSLGCITFRFQDAVDTSLFPLQLIQIPMVGWERNHEMREHEQAGGSFENLNTYNMNSNSKQF
ncbi:hypothetical protein HK096_000910 [Nowakowskiella sp. JEL0078]|nr:hypothetical protein HK096_000910 [Nowakowskiella sp. JEL0078]